MAPAPEIDAELQETIAAIGIQRLQGAYADIINRRAFAELDALFTDDCPVTIDTRTREPLRFVGAAQLGEFIAGAVERFDFFEFVILSTRLDIDGPATATGRLYMCEIRHERESGFRTEAFGVYHDRYLRDAEAGWQFRERRYHTLARSAPFEDATRDLDVFPFPS